LIARGDEMDNQWSTSEIIRRTALNYLAAHPQGIRAVDLRKLTEEVLCDYIPQPEGGSDIYKSALWNLEKLYPDYVVRIALTPRKVMLYPSSDLEKHIINGEFAVPQLESYIEVPDPDSELSEHIGQTIDVDGFIQWSERNKGVKFSQELRMAMIKSLVGELSDYIKESGLLKLLELSEEDLKEMRNDEVEAIASLKMQLNIIIKHRNQFFHGKF
jgi:hypothetical protein